MQFESIVAAILLLLLSGKKARVIGAAQAPFDPQAGTDLIVPRGAFKACGLVETTASDPDWIVATSDRIFRQSLCVASSTGICQGAEDGWYDRPFNPCYPENRFWKLTEGSGTAFAYPLAALGVGSFDSLYVRRNVKLQFYQGVGDSVPFGPLLNGPKYVSITWWRDNVVACDGFEPGTFFVEGGQGALSDYSLKIGGIDSTSILDIDLKEKDNEKDHHTDKYKDHFALRRATSFTIFVKLAKEYGPDCYDLVFEARHDFDGAETVIEIPSSDLSWDIEEVDITTNGDGTKTVEAKIIIPDDAPIGEYKFKALLREIEETTAIAEEDFPEDIIILFNPWSSTDAASRGSSLDEYVLKENGPLWFGEWNSNGNTNWRYMQFSEDTVVVLLELLDGQPSAMRSSPALTSQHLADAVRNSDTGILYGKWSKPYTGGSEPTSWHGSDTIIRQYRTSGGTTVRYAQCWVFAGVLNTFLRSAGLAAHPVTTFNSGSDHDNDKIIDRYYTTLGFLDGRTVDSYWNFHVWNDVWFSSEWHAVDATYEIGPAALSKVKANSGGQYEVDFVFAEVDALYREWKETYFGLGSDVLTLSSTNWIGRYITSKTLDDITAEYKTPDVFRMLETTSLPEIDVTFGPPETILAGSTLALEVILSNSIADLYVRVLISATAISYDDGSFRELLDSVEEFINITTGGGATTTLSIDPSSYINSTNIIESYFSLDIENSTSVAACSARTTLSYPDPLLEINPSGASGVGSNVDVSFEFENTLTNDISDVFVIYSVSDGLSVGGLTDIEIDYGTLAAGATLQVSRQVSLVAEGEHGLAVTLLGDKIHRVFADAFIVAFLDCNGNGSPDEDDILDSTSQDCNTNGIPDECEDDCNGNSIPDDCDVFNDPSLDCNGNGLPDECDIASGVSQDQNSNGVPDECDPDCNNNGTPDDLDIGCSNETSFDFNNNGIPDECDSDCNMNGIDDEVDIADETSLDLNQNGVPDDCEVLPDHCNASPASTCSKLVGLLEGTWYHFSFLGFCFDWCMLIKFVAQLLFMMEGPCPED